MCSLLFGAILRSTNSPFPWPGGKRLLKKLLLSLLPEHLIYVEPFAGSAKLLFAKQQARFEILNDLNGDVTNFFRVAKHRAAELAELFETECVHAERFRELRLTSEPECELDRALRFAYLAWFSFGGKGEHFASAYASHGRARRPLTRVRELLRATAHRLAAVQIEQRDFTEILIRYDSPETLFYLDPPYVHFQSNGRYTALAPDRRDLLFAALASVKGRFLMSFDDCPEVRALAAQHGFDQLPVEVAYTLSGAHHSASPKAAELLLANYPLITKGKVSEV